MDDQTFERMESEMRSLTAELASFTEAERAEALHFIDEGEFGVALETIFGIALEEAKSLTPSIKTRLESLADEMGLAGTIDTQKLS